MTYRNNTVRCPKCGHDRNPSTARSCEICGQSLKGFKIPPIGWILGVGILSVGSYFAWKHWAPALMTGTIPSFLQLLPQDSPSFTLLGDTFSGYSTFRNAGFQKALSEMDLTLRYENEFDQAQRAQRLNQGSADLIVTTLDQFLQQQPEGKIIALIDRTIGADAVVLNTKKYPGLNSLLVLNRLVVKEQAQGRQLAMTFAGDTPSEYLALVLAAKFDNFRMGDFQIRKVTDASESWAMLQDPSQPVAIAVLWEPFVTQARQRGYTVVLSSQDAPGAIVDVLVASDRLMAAQPQRLSDFVETYYRHIDANVRSASQLQQQIAQDGNLSVPDAAAVLQGIDFFTALEANQWLTDGTLARRIQSTAAVLALAGRLNQVPTDPASLLTPTLISRAAKNSQTLIELVKADNPALAERLAGKNRAITPTLSNRQMAAAPDIGNLKVQGEVKFTAGSAQLTPQGQETLKQLVQEIREFNSQTVAVRVIGHTSRTGTASLNQILSQQRAQSVVTYFKQAGLTHNVVATGQGFSNPIPGLAPQDARQQRTEIRLVRVK